MCMSVCSSVRYTPPCKMCRMYLQMVPYLTLTLNNIQLNTHTICVRVSVHGGLQVLLHSMHTFFNVHLYGPQHTQLTHGSVSVNQTHNIQYLRMQCALCMLSTPQHTTLATMCYQKALMEQKKRQRQQQNGMYIGLLCTGDKYKQHITALCNRYPCFFGGFFSFFYTLCLLNLQPMYKCEHAIRKFIDLRHEFIANPIKCLNCFCN